MPDRWRNSYLTISVLALCAGLPGSLQAQGAENAPLTVLIEHYSADSASLMHAYPLEISPARRERFTRFNEETLAALKEVRFDGLDEEGKADYLLLKNHVDHELHTLSREQKEFNEIGVQIGAPQ